MELLNLTSTSLTSGSALPALGLNYSNAALERLQTSAMLAETQNLLDGFARVTMQQNLQKLMELFASLMKNEAPQTNTSPVGGSSSANQAGPSNQVSPPSNVKKTARATGTGYFPDNSAMEGGYVDRKGKKLNTLQDFLAGKADYVSVAMDKNENIPYGTKLRIPELEKKYGRPIEFRVVDTGGAFTGKGNSRIDICTANQKASTDSTINGPLTLQFV
ncbi:hypothetical protein JST97_35285 [bacterium]|nr:hypothetical protein [bacterium]